MTTFSSRPDEQGVSALDLSHTELELLCALLCSVKLGSGISIYRDAAYVLLCKVVEYGTVVYNDPEFCENSCDAVDVTVNTLDSAGHFIENLDGAEFEILV